MPATDKAPRKSPARKPLPDPLPGDEKVYAPEARLKGQGWRMHIQRKGTLSETQERRYRRIALPRARVEQILAGLAQLGGKTLCPMGLSRATLHLNLKTAAHNLRRFTYLKQAGIVAF